MGPTPDLGICVLTSSLGGTDAHCSITLGLLQNVEHVAAIQ